MTPDLTKRFGCVDSLFAAVYNDVEAWVCVNGVWHEWNVFEVRFKKAKHRSPADFVDEFPALPPLPKEAFSEKLTNC